MWKSCEFSENRSMSSHPRKKNMVNNDTGRSSDLFLTVSETFPKPLAGFSGISPWLSWKLPQRDCPGFSPVFPINRHLSNRCGRKVTTNFHCSKKTPQNNQPRAGCGRCKKTERMPPGSGASVLMFYDCVRSRLGIFGTEGADGSSGAPHLALAESLKLFFEFLAIVGLGVGVD